MIKNIGIVGYGSIGRKHHQILKKLNKKFIFYINTKQKGVDNSVQSLEEFSKIDLDYIIISNPTSQHYQTLKFLDKKFTQKKFLIEKPLFQFPAQLDTNSNQLFVGYNLRFHPAVNKLISLIKGKKIISVSIKTYSYLPSWRKNISYDESSSAFKSQGGGVLRDLSHEIDLVNYLFGGLHFHYANSSKISNLNIETDDYLLTCGKLNCGAPFVIELNYFSRFNSREIFVETLNESIKLNLSNSELTFLTKEKKNLFQYDADNSCTYSQMHKEIMKKNGTNACTIEEGMHVLEQINAIEELTI
jgi:predicted dehydrogenase